MRVNGAVLVGMLLINWLTGLVGLGNLIFLWPNKHYRNRAAIALGLTLGTGLIYRILTSFGIAWPFIPMVFWLPLGMAIWMTVDAVRAYNTYR